MNGPGTVTFPLWGISTALGGSRHRFPLEARDDARLAGGSGRRASDGAAPFDGGFAPAPKTSRNVL